MNFERVPMDLAAYERRILSGTCFVCGIVSGDPHYDHERVVFEDDAHIAFLDRYPTVYGKVLVAPKAHVEHVVQQFHALMLENGVIPWSAAQAAELATKLRAVLRGA